MNVLLKNKRKTPATESEQKEDIIPVQVTEPNSSTLDRGMTCHSFSMQRFQEQQQPSFSFGSSHIQGCTINIYQSLPVSKDLFNNFFNARTLHPLELLICC